MQPVELLRPELLILLLLVVAFLFLRRRYWRMTLFHSQADAFLGTTPEKPPGWLYLPRILDWAAILLLVGVFIEPVLPIGQRRTEVRALDLVLCIDLSSSMRKSLELTPPSLAGAEVPTRLDAVKQVAQEFIASRPRDRIGLVVFSANGYIVNPLTTDHQVLSQYIDLMDGNTLIGEGLTSLGEGMLVSNQLLAHYRRTGEGGGKAIIVFTDAEQNYGRKPDRPLEEARRQGTEVYFVGVGVPIESVLGRMTTAVLATGGNYFDAFDARALVEVSRQIDRLQRSTIQVTQYFRNRSLTLPLLMGACLLWILNCALRALPVFYATN